MRGDLRKSCWLVHSTYLVELEILYKSTEYKLFSKLYLYISMGWIFMKVLG